MAEIKKNQLTNIFNFISSKYQRIKYYNSRQLAAGSTVSALLAALGLADRRVAVERNREVVPRPEHAHTVLADGDRLELVTFVGGG